MICQTLEGKQLNLLFLQFLRDIQELILRPQRFDFIVLQLDLMGFYYNFTISVYILQLFIT